MRLFYQIAFIIISVNFSAFAQIPSHDMNYSHSCSEYATTQLQTSPPYQWNMPIEIFQAYFAIDSLCRTPFPTAYSELYTLMADAMTQESIDSVSKYLYRVIGYNPLLFYKYIFQGRFLNNNYINAPEVFYYIFNELRIKSSAGIDPFLAIAAGIYHIEVTNVYIDTTYLSPTRNHLVVITCIEADVLTTIKGQSLISTYFDPETGSEHAQIKFSYANYWETKHKEGNSTSDISIDFQSSDSLISSQFKSYKYGEVHSPYIGDQFVLFALLNFEPHTTSNGTLYNIWPLLGSQYEGGLFPVTGGIVSDSSNFFGFGTGVPVGSFLTMLSNYILDHIYN